MAGSRRSGIALSPRQREVAGLLCDDLSHDEIAHRLGVTLSTVDVHIGFLRAKTGRTTTLAAIADLVRLRLV